MKYRKKHVWQDANIKKSLKIRLIIRLGNRSGWRDGGTIKDGVKVISRTALQQSKINGVIFCAKGNCKKAPPPLFKSLVVDKRRQLSPLRALQYLKVVGTY